MYFDLDVKLRNLYVDREITGEVFLQPYKYCNQLIQKSFVGDKTLSKIARLVSQSIIYLFLGPLVLVGMVIKCLNVHQVREYNERIKGHISNREVAEYYFNQPDTARRFPIVEEANDAGMGAVFTRLDEGSKYWERVACNILGYVGRNEVIIQYIARSPRWQIPEGVVRPFAS